MSARQLWITASGLLPITRQCSLAGVTRSLFYSLINPTETDTENQLFMDLIDEEYTLHPFYGSRRMVHHLKSHGHQVNRKHVQRLMRIMGLAGMAPGPNTSSPHPEHKIYPYLLRGVDITRPNQVWSTDITYIRLKKGFAYLVAVIDWYSRKVLAWQLSNTLDTSFCIECLEEALLCYGKPDIFNTDQGSQFTSAAFTGLLKDKGILISMDGRGRALDNIFVERLWRSVKHENIYPMLYETMTELKLGLTAYFSFYNSERFHQSLGYKTPDAVYLSGKGGGAKIVDKFGDTASLTGAIGVSPNLHASVFAKTYTNCEAMPCC